MKTADFDYHLEEELIAQTPLEDRASSRLLVLKNGIYEDHTFSDIVDFLNPGDALVLNETKVLPARIIGTKKDTGGVVELLLLKDLGSDVWECLARPQKRLKPGTEIIFGLNGSENYPLKARVTEILDEGITRVKFIYNGIFLEILERLGTMPLPPYIHEQLQDQSRYQTVYAKNLGSAAAPTAGLHFTPELLDKIEAKGIKIIRITLHVGLGTFRPVQVDDVKDHQMHTEAYEVSKKAADDLNHVRKTGGHIIAVGTTTVRTLETVMEKYGRFEGCVGETSIFIYPGFKFQAIDAMITNFHLPKSTLLMLVSAFAGKDFIMKAYAHAVKAKYRFFSFGDAMFIEGENYES